MQKMMEQQQLQQQRANRPPSLLASGPMPPQNMIVDQTSGVPAERQASSSGWQGVLSWAGFDVTTQGRKEVRAQVAAIPQGGADL
jgi:hypothetical protein